MHASVRVYIDAPPEKVWNLVSDVTQIGNFSPETFEAEWLDGATGPAPGARFRGHVRRNEKGPVYWTTCSVIESEPGKVFSFGVGKPGAPLNTWKYRLEPNGDGTDITESFALTPSLLLRVYWLLFGWARGRRNRNDMRRTLEKVKALAESGS